MRYREEVRTRRVWRAWQELDHKRFCFMPKNLDSIVVGGVEVLEGFKENNVRKVVGEL
jgi:hypothetical protein